MQQYMLQYMLAFLTTPEQLFFLSSCKTLYEVNELAKIIRLLSLVMRGQREKARIMIEGNRELLQQSVCCTDGAGRYFNNITPLKYAVWAWDARMWTMMLPLFPDANSPGLSPVASRQLQELKEEKGKHGSYFNFEPIIEAYKLLIDCQGVMESYKDQLGWLWYDIGRQQRLLPDHIWQEFLLLARFLAPFEFKCFIFDIDNDIDIDNEPLPQEWWRTAQRNGGGLGETWTAYWFSKSSGIITPWEEMDEAKFREWCGGYRMYGISDPLDFNALRAFITERRTNRDELYERFRMNSSEIGTCRGSGQI